MSTRGARRSCVEPMQPWDDVALPVYAKFVRWAKILEWLDDCLHARTEKELIIALHAGAMRACCSILFYPRGVQVMWGTTIVDCLLHSWNSAIVRLQVSCCLYFELDACCRVGNFLWWIEFSKAYAGLQSTSILRSGSDSTPSWTGQRVERPHGIQRTSNSMRTRCRQQYQIRDSMSCESRRADRSCCWW
jgi:hypothetical protein